MMNTIIKKEKIIMFVIGICQSFFILALFELIQVRLSYRDISVIAIVQCIVNIILLKMFCNLSVICLPNMFSVFSLFFHCGQIIKEGFNIQGTVPLPFQYYTSESIIREACFFYLLSQAAYFIGVASISGMDNSLISNKWKQRNEIASQQYGKFLILIGIVPRLYIDIRSFMGALSQGYKGVYSIYFPQMIQSMAFFFDAGIILYLLGCDNKKKARKLVIVVLLYKCLMMTSGARQEKVAYLLVFLYLYFFVCNKITIGKLIIIVCGGIAGFNFISAIGNVRVGANSGIQAVFELIQSGQMSDIVGSALGEFGSAFDTLELAMAYTPDCISYGYGASYLAGALSIIPLVVKQIPVLDRATIFVQQLPRSVNFALGGSYLGELYYNFSWFGIIGSILIGRFMKKLHCGIELSTRENTLYGAWCAIVSTAMILFIRGYFTDMMQKLVWTYLVICITYSYIKRRYAKCLT